MFDYFGIDPKVPADTVPLSQLPAFIRDAKRAFTATFISGVEFEAGTVFGDAVFYDKDTQKWRRSIWIAGSMFNVDGFAIPQYGGVSTGSLVHGPWMFEGGTELYLSGTNAGKIFPLGADGEPTPADGAFMVGRQVSPGVILFAPGVSLAKSYADSAKLSAENAAESAVDAAESAAKAEESIAKIETVRDEAILVIKDGIVTVRNAIDNAVIEINTIAEQTISFVRAVGDDQLLIIRNAGAVARRELEIVAEDTINKVKTFVLAAQVAAGNAEHQASLALVSKNSAEQAATQAVTAQHRIQSLKTLAVEGSIPEASYDGASNTIRFTLPAGPRGPQGLPAPAGDKGPTGDMGPIPSGAAFGKMFVGVDGMLVFEYLDLAGVIGADTFKIDSDGYLVAADV